MRIRASIARYIVTKTASRPDSLLTSDDLHCRLQVTAPSLEQGEVSFDIFHAHANP